jgi:pimeloyl-ACP methyl ester carboxylesterase
VEPKKHKPASENLLPTFRISDLRGLVQLAEQATVEVTRVVEGVHQSVWSTLGFSSGEDPGRTRGITGLVYKFVFGVTHIVGRSVGAALAGLESLVGSDDDAAFVTPERDTLLAGINGVMGDRLLADDNPFAIRMALRCRGRAFKPEDLPSSPKPTGKVLILIHGLCMSDLQWRAENDGNVVDHGEELAAALGSFPVSVRYNSGLHISDNGRELAALLEQLVARWPVPVEELSVVAHSMGGLLIRSAHHAATLEHLRWPKRLKNIVFLGTPHHGAPLEQAANWVDSMLGKTPYTAPFGSLCQLRSSGITDLRYGHLLGEDWQERDRFEHAPDSRRIVPLPDGVACFAVAATTASQPGFLANRLIGDGLVLVDSALGRHRDARRDLGLPSGSQKVEYRMNHLELLSSPEVTRQMVRWLTH